MSVNIFLIYVDEYIYILIGVFFTSTSISIKLSSFLVNLLSIVLSMSLSTDKRKYFYVQRLRFSQFLAIQEPQNLFHLDTFQWQIKNLFFSHYYSQHVLQKATIFLRVLRDFCCLPKKCSFATSPKI